MSLEIREWNERESSDIQGFGNKGMKWKGSRDINKCEN